MRTHRHGIHGVLGLRRVRFTVAVLATLAGVVAVVKGCGPPSLRQIGAVAQPSRLATSVAFSSDGRLVASGTRSVYDWKEHWMGHAAVWEAVGFSHVTTLPNSRWVNAVSFSPDGKTLAVACGVYASPGARASGGTPYPEEIGEITLWDIDGWKERATLKHAQPVFACKFSPDGRVMASLAGGAPSQPNQVDIWDTTTGTIRWTLRDCAGCTPGFSPLLSGDGIDFSPDGALLGVVGHVRHGGSAVGLIQLWDIGTGELRSELKVRSWEGALGIALHSRTLATVREVSPQVDVYDLLTGQFLRTLRADVGYSAHALAFSPDGRTLATAGWIPLTGLFEPEPIRKSHGYLALWDLGSGNCTAAVRIRERGAGIQALAFSPDGKTLATGDFIGGVRTWAVPEARWPTK
ncbi:MAG: WD40 repeat domain-containing protein [Pirellulaceae bacterium]